MAKTNSYINIINQHKAEIEAHNRAIKNLEANIFLAKKNLVVEELCKRKIKVKKENSNRYVGAEIYIDITPETNAMYATVTITDEKLKPCKGQTWKNIFQELAMDTDLYLFYEFTDYYELENNEFESMHNHIDDCWIEELADFYIEGKLKAFPL